MMTTPEAIRIEQEVRTAGGVPEILLRHKCQWEQMSRLAVMKVLGEEL